MKGYLRAEVALMGLICLLGAALANAAAVGSTAGQFEVSDSGSATYTIPITVPPGIGGMKPALSLTYNSMGGHGEVGVGFALSGPSQISRCGSTIYQHGFTDNVDFDADDRFCMDGQLLIPIGANEFRTEIASFSRIIANGSLDDPSSFTVQTKAGLTMEYGGTDDSRLEANGTFSGRALKWAVSSVTDTSGNQITWQYFKNAAFGEQLPIFVYYAYVSGYPAARVALDYDYIPTPAFAFSAGALLTSNSFMLKEVRTEVIPLNASQWTKARTYSLDYDTGGHAGRYRLRSVTECGHGASGTECFEPTTFDWTAPGTYGWTSRNGGTHTIGSLAETDIARVQFADFNADGKTDIYINDGANTSSDGEIRLSNGDGTFTSTRSGITYFKGNTNFADFDVSRLRIADLNADGAADAVLFSGNRAEIYINNGNATFTHYPNPSGIPPLGVNGYPDNSRPLFGDFNGDGLIDIGYIIDTGVTSPIRLYLNNGNGTSFTPVNGPSIFKAGTNKGLACSLNGVKTGDFNGDGITDFYVMPWFYGMPNPSTASLYLSTGPATWSHRTGLQHAVSQSDEGCHRDFARVQVADMNGDGIDDLINGVGYGSTVPIWFHFSRGDGTFYPVILGPDHLFRGSDANAHADALRIRVADLNGDGLNDLYIPTGISTTTPIKLHINRGVLSNGYLMFDTYDGPSFYIHGDLPGGRRDMNRIKPVDIYGIGRPQLYYIGGTGKDNGIFGETYANLPANIFSFNLTNGDRIASVQNGLGATVNVSYKPLTNASVYSKGTRKFTYPEMSVVGAMYVASEYSTDNGIGGLRRTSFFYQGASAYLDGRGYRGFERVKVQDHATGIVDDKTFSIVYPHVGTPKSVVRSVNNRTISTTNNTLDYKDLRDGKIFPFVKTSIVEAYEINSLTLVSRTVSTFNYDEPVTAFHGNLTSSVETTYSASGAQTHQTTTVNEYADNTANWFLGRLRRTSVTKSSNGLQATRNTEFDYNANTGLLIWEIVEPGAPGGIKLVKKHERHANGLVSRQVAEENGLLPRNRVTTNGYDSRGQFVTSVKNSLNHITQSAYDLRTGNVTSRTDANGLTTTWGYDPLGRVVSETRPDGTVTTTSRLSCSYQTPACAPSAVLRIEVKGSDGSRAWTDMDILEREVGGGRAGFLGQAIVWESDYDAKGQVIRKSVPHFIGEARYDSINVYDLVGRISQSTSPGGPGVGARQTTFVYDGLTTVQIDANGQRTTRVSDEIGQLLRVTDTYGGASTFTHDPHGNVLTATDAEGNQIVNTYDIRGNKLSTVDPDLGVWTYTYNNHSELLTQTNANGQKVTMTYDVLGRMKTRQEPEGKTEWQWDNQWKGALTSVKMGNAYTRTMRYDPLGRVASTTTRIGGVDYIVSNTYDAQSRLETLNYPEGFALRYQYSATGHVRYVRNAANNQLYWQGKEQDPFGNWTNYRYGNGVETYRHFDFADGWLRAIVSGKNAGSDVLSHDYDWDVVGNLERRTDHNLGGTYEDFSYDALNRLTRTRLTTSSGAPVADLRLTYSSIGNIRTKSDVGTYTYGSRPHAVTSISGARTASFTYDGNGNQLTGDGRTFTWASYNLPTRIERGAGSVVYQYGPDREPIFQTTVRPTDEEPIPKCREGDIICQWLGTPPIQPGVRNVTYVGGIFERHETSDGITFRNTIMVGGQAIGVYIQTDSGAKLEYHHRDHMDSVTAVTNHSGAVIERLSYDSFGKRRNIDWRPDPQEFQFEAYHFTDWGFTGHEHIDSVALIHMKGRVYDPILGRFTSPDPFVQFPDSTQGFNRYSYVNNNPLSYTDPSGFFLKRIGREFKRWEQDFRHEIRRPGSYLGSALRIVGTALSYFCGPGFSGCVAGVAAATEVTVSAAEGVKGGDLIRNVAISAATAYAAANINGPQFALNAPTRAALHGLRGGLTSIAQGGEFGPGFLAGGFGSAAGGVDVGNYGGNLIVASVVGGTASELGGGKFANGAVTGAFSYLASSAAARRPPGRGLTSGERTLAESVYQDSIDYGGVRIIEGKFHPFQPDNTYIAPNGNIYAPSDIYSADYSLERLAIRSDFIHEMAHVLQYQEGVNVAWQGVKLFLSGRYSKSNVNQTYTPHRGSYLSQNIEQQAELWRSNYLDRHRMGAAP